MIESNGLDSRRCLIEKDLRHSGIDLIFGTGRRKKRYTVSGQPY
jgi:hypothetical protein